MADQFCTTSGRIAQVAKERGWNRDLSRKIKEKAQAKVQIAEAKAKLSNVEKKLKEAKKKLSSDEIVEINSEIQAGIIRAHRHDIGRNRSLAIKILGELEATTENIELFRELGELMRCPDQNGQDRRNDLYMRVISMTGRVGNLKALADTLKTLVVLERQAFGLDSGEGEGKDRDALPLEDRLKQYREQATISESPNVIPMRKAG